MPNSKIILGIDPGTAITGYGIIQVSSHTVSTLEYGVIRTAEHEVLEQRLWQLHQDLVHIITKYTPEIAGCEQIFFSKNIKTASAVLQARGVILMTLAQHNIPMMEFTPPQIKLAITGYGSAEKQQIQYMTQQILNLPSLPQPDDAADALAIALATSNLC